MTALATSTGRASAPVDANRLLSAPGPGLRDHLTRFGVLPPVSPALFDELRLSGLSGRGGAAFATWRKLASARASAPVAVVANGAEGEPLSSKDAVLLQRAPHLVIDGLLVVGRLLGTSALTLYAAAAQLSWVARALGERTDAAAIRLVEAPDIFLSGEASAVVNALSGGRPIPFDHRIPLAQANPGRVPTVVQNVETLAQIALIARFGGDWFGRTGTADEPGSRLFTLCGDVPRPGVVEAAGGLTIAEVLSRSGVEGNRVRAVLVGGYHGAWVPASALDRPLTAHALDSYGAMPGAGVLMVLEGGRCGIRTASRIATYLAAQSARQCGPCTNGLPAMAETLAALATPGHDPALLDRVRHLADLVKGRGSCHHPDGTVRLVLSTLTVFAEDVPAHQHGYCLEAAR